MTAPVNPGLHEEYDWPTMEDIIESQRNASTAATEKYQLEGIVFRTRARKLWIPGKDAMLQLRILIPAHTGKGGHRATDTTYETVAAHFWWKELRKKPSSSSNLAFISLPPSTVRLYPDHLATLCILPNQSSSDISTIASWEKGSGSSCAH